MSVCQRASGVTNRDINQRENCKILYACEEAQKSENVMENGKQCTTNFIYFFATFTSYRIYCKCKTATGGVGVFSRYLVAVTIGMWDYSRRYLARIVNCPTMAKIASNAMLISKLGTFSQTITTASEKF